MIGDERAGYPIGDERDEFVERVRGALTPLPSVDPRATARVLAAVAADAAARGTSRAVDDDAPGLVPGLAGWGAAIRRWLRTPVVSFGGAGAIAGLALVVGFLARGAVNGGSPDMADAARAGEGAPAVTQLGAVDPGAGATAADSQELDLMAPMGMFPRSSPLQAMTDDGDVSAPVPVQFVFEAGSARRVSLVGDFNAWSADSARMERAPDGGAWTVTVWMTPGRHVYAFVVDGERWVADPRAPAAPDADFGRPGSVIMVRPR